MIETYKKYTYLAGFLIVVLSGIFAGSQFMNVDLMEARNFVTAREMISNQNWLIPTMNGELRIAKPPLPTWATAVSMIAAHTDTNLVFNRLPAGIISLLMIFFIYRLAKSISKSNDVAIYSAIVLSTSYMFMYMARKGTWDIFAHSFMLGAIWVYHSSLINCSKRYRNYIFAGLLMGLSWMSKGPVAFYALLLPFVIGQLAVYKTSLFKGNLKYIALMMLACVTLCSVWPVYILLNISTHAQQTVVGETTAWFSRHIKPFWYYLQFPTMAGIWVFIITPLLWPKYATKKISDIKNYRLMFIWLVTMIILLCIFPEKKDRYLLPATVPMSIIIAFYLKYLVNSFKKEQLLKDDKIIIRIYLVLNIFMSAMTIFAVLYEFTQSGFSDELFILLVASILSSYAIFRSIRFHSGSSFVFAFVVSFIVLINVTPSLAQNVVGKKDFMSLKELRPLIKKQNTTLYSFNDNMKVVWAAGSQIIKSTPHDLKENPMPQPALYLANNRDIEQELTQSGIRYEELQSISNSQEQTLWILYKIDNTKNPKG